MRVSSFLVRPWIYFLLAVVIASLYAPAAHFEFVNFDDPIYAGPASHSVSWAFTSTGGANWFPLTRLSLMAFGPSSEAAHVGNVILHTLATLLLFAFLSRATGAPAPSAFVAFVFGVHPLHVESVAWVSERKDVLCAFFWFLALWLYVSRARLVFVGLAFAAGLMSKPMIVTLPFLLLLADYWPLQRKPLFRGKIPFFVLSAISGIVTYLVQSKAGAVRTSDFFPLTLRIENALVSLAIYPMQFFWPARLAVFYPYPAAIPIWIPVLSALFIASVSIAAWRTRRSHGYFLFGWFWYLISIAPVIGIVQVGAQAHADRYMYVPSVGLAVVIAWGAARSLAAYPRIAKPFVAAAVLACASLTAAAAVQIPYWRDSVTLFRHAIEVTRANDLAEHNLGDALLEIPGRLPEAIAHLRESLRMRPDSIAVHSDLAMALAKAPERLEEAETEARTAVQLDPASPIPHNNLGSILMQRGYAREAASEFQEALRLYPEYAGARNNLASDNNAESHYNAAMAFAKSPGKEPEAIREFETAIRLNPNYAEAHNNLGVILAADPAKTTEAIQQFQTALKINPNYEEAHYNLGVALSNSPERLRQSIAEFEAAYKIHRDPHILDILKKLKNSR